MSCAQKCDEVFASFIAGQVVRRIHNELLTLDTSTSTSLDHLPCSTNTYLQIVTDIAIVYDLCDVHDTI